MKKADIVFNVFLIALSIFAFTEALGYPYYDRFAVGAGFFPRWVSGILFVLALTNILRLILSIKKEGDGIQFFIGNFGRNRILVIALSLILYIVAISYVGILWATLVYAILLYKFFDKFTWKSTLPAAIGLVVFIYLVFMLALRLRMPRSIFGF